MTPDTPPPAGWYTDPNNEHEQRWWTGMEWSSHTRVPPASAGASSSSGLGALPVYAPQQGYGTATPTYDHPNVTGMGSAIRTVFERYSDLRGRAGRPEYWYWNLALFLSVFLFAIGAGFVDGQSGASEDTATAVVIVALIGAILVLVPSITVTVRRLQDAGLHGALIFLGFIPYVGGIVLLVLCCMPSKNPVGAGVSTGVSAR